jgi:hypothetical protein
VKFLGTKQSLKMKILGKIEEKIDTNFFQKFIQKSGKKLVGKLFKKFGDFFFKKWKGSVINYCKTKIKKSNVACAAIEELAPGRSTQFPLGSSPPLQRASTPPPRGRLGGGAATATPPGSSSVLLWVRAPPPLRSSAEGAAPHHRRGPVAELCWPAAALRRSEGERE